MLRRGGHPELLLRHVLALLHDLDVLVDHAARHHARDHVAAVAAEEGDGPAMLSPTYAVFLPSGGLVVSDSRNGRLQLLSDDTAGEALFVINRVSDGIFLLDMILQFFRIIRAPHTCRPPSPSGAQEEARGEGKGCLICSVEQPCLYDLDAVSARFLCLAGC